MKRHDCLACLVKHYDLVKIKKGRGFNFFNGIEIKNDSEMDIQVLVLEDHG